MPSKYWTLLVILFISACGRHELLLKISDDGSPPVEGTSEFGHLMVFEAGFDSDTVEVYSGEKLIIGEVLTISLAGYAGDCRVFPEASRNLISIKVNGKQTEGFSMDNQFRFAHVSYSKADCRISIELTNLVRQYW